jgi:hypothetical protein
MCQVKDGIQGSEDAFPVSFVSFLRFFVDLFYAIMDVDFGTLILVRHVVYAQKPKEKTTVEDTL